MPNSPSLSGFCFSRRMYTLGMCLHIHSAARYLWEEKVILRRLHLMLAHGEQLCLPSAIRNNHFESKDFHSIFIDSDSDPADFGFRSLASYCNWPPGPRNCSACFWFVNALAAAFGFQIAFALLGYLYGCFLSINQIDFHYFVALIFHFHLLRFWLQCFAKIFIVITLYFQFIKLEQLLAHRISCWLGPELFFPLIISIHI